jgi:hypothetical protein
MTTMVLGHFIAENRVNLLETTLFGFTAWQIYLVAALLLCLLLARIHSSRVAAQHGGGDKRTMSGATGIKYTDAPTVRLTDTQRIDRLHRLVSLKTGEHADLLDLTFGRLPRLSVALAGIEHESGQDFAHIQIELGGAAAGCGAGVKELEQNHFLVPRALPDDQRCSILYFCGKPDAVSFLQIKVKRLDPVEQSAAIDVLHVRGRWAA